jgi:hypothetical protein
MTPRRFTIRRMMMTVLGSGLLLGLVINARSFMADGDWMAVLSPILLGAIAIFAIVSIGLAVIFLFQLSKYRRLPISSVPPEPE